MTLETNGGAARRNGSGPFHLVCAVCDGPLDEGPYATRAGADQAADEHALEAHPARQVVVLPLPIDADGPELDRLLAFAREAQAVIDRAHGTEDGHAPHL